MFTDARSRKVVLVSHCILNQNSISDGTADYPAADQSIVKLLLEANIGIIQMPCPELLSLGLDRGDKCGAERPVVVENTRIRHSLEKAESAKVLNNLVNQLVFQIAEYLHHGFKVLGIIGINRSPSCGVDTTSDYDREVDGQGVFIARLKEELTRRNIMLDIVGIKALEAEESLATVEDLLAKHC